MVRKLMVDNNFIKDRRSVLFDITHFIIFLSIVIEGIKTKFSNPAKYLNIIIDRGNLASVCKQNTQTKIAKFHNCAWYAVHK